MKNSLWVLLILWMFQAVSCTESRVSIDSKPGIELHFLSSYVLPPQHFEGTTVGGLSGIDYDPGKEVYYLISDDRSEINPARFYTAKIGIQGKKIDTVFITAKTFLRDHDGKLYPPASKNRNRGVDPEAMRYDQSSDNWVWTSEGERIVNDKDTILLNPAITIIGKDGNYMDTFPLPPQLRVSAAASGIRQNGALEGLTFSKDFSKMYVSVEEPLLQDDHRAGPGDSSAMVRILEYQVNNKKPVAQYGYRIDPVAYEPMPAGGFKVNGISDILWLDKDRLLVVERSYSTGRLSCTIKVFLADLSNTSPIEKMHSIKGKTIREVRKKLVLNMDDLGIFTDNIEGVTFGPVLPNGHRSLIFVADNNFNAFEINQFLLFEVR